MTGRWRAAAACLGVLLAAGGPECARGALGAAIEVSEPAVCHAADDEDVFAIRARPGGDDSGLERLGASLRRRLRATPIRSDVAAQAGILLFRKPANQPASEFRKRLERWLSANTSARPLDVVAHERGYSVATGRVIVELAAEVPHGRGRSVLAGMGATIVAEPTWFRPTRFVVEAADADRRSPAELARAIGALAEVRFAEPDRLIVSVRQPAS